MKRLTVIDLDSIVYVIAYRHKDEEGVMAAIIVQDEVKETIDTIVSKTEAEAYAGFYQKEGHTNFRKEFYPEYKAHRPPTPEYVKYWRPYIHEVFNSYKGVTGLEVIESDDALSIYYYKYMLEYQMTFAHNDKDLNCIPGRHCNLKGENFKEVKVDQGDYIFKCQVLAGDSTDNIKGVPGVGKVWAAKHMDKHVSVFKAFRAAYKKAKLPDWIRNCYLNYHLIRLLHSIDELKQFTDKKEVDIFNTIDCFEYDQVDHTGLQDW